jgi:hypothetical protein
VVAASRPYRIEPYDCGVASIEDEIAEALELSQDMINAYVGWYDSIRFTDIRNLVYSNMFDFVNFRVETADSCLGVIRQSKIADSLGLSRSLLENYLLLMLMCRGRKYFQLRSYESATPEEFEGHLKEQQAKLEEHGKTSDTGALCVAKYPRAKRHLMYVFEGLISQDDDLVIPWHFFRFQEFRPEAMRLKDIDYFEYYDPGPEIRRAQKDQRGIATDLYRFYLSYDALLQCLELNGLVDADVIARIEAHYTFLGKFLHPTHDAARLLHENSNWHSGRTAIGMGQAYAKTSVLLAAIYVAYLLAGILDEVMGFVESAPKMYVVDPGTADLRSLTRSVGQRFPYFWFLFGGPPLWDKFNHALYHLDNDALASYGGYANVPDSEVAFDSDIYGHLVSAIRGGHNVRVGTYRSPIYG